MSENRANTEEVGPGDRKKKKKKREIRPCVLVLSQIVTKDEITQTFQLYEPINLLLLRSVLCGIFLSVKIVLKSQ